MDGLPGLEVGLKTATKEHIAPIEKMVGPHAPKRYQNNNNNNNRFGFKHLLLVAVLTTLLHPLISALVATIFPDLVSSFPDLQLFFQNLLRYYW